MFAFSKRNTVGPLFIESLWAKKPVSAGALGAPDDMSKLKYERAVEFLLIIPIISSGFCHEIICQVQDTNSNCGDSILAKFNNYRSYGNFCFGYFDVDTYIWLSMTIDENSFLFPIFAVVSPGNVTQLATFDPIKYSLYCKTESSAG